MTRLAARIAFTCPQIWAQYVLAPYLLMAHREGPRSIGFVAMRGEMVTVWERGK
jgi:hypothetical protein